MARGGPRINHLHFLDDSVIFYRAKQTVWNHLQSILSVYEKISGQALE